MDTKPVAQFLEDEGFGNLGVNIFRDNMPAKAIPALLVTQQTADRIHPDVDCYAIGVFEVVAREKTFDAARATLNSVTDVMNGGKTLGNMRFLHLRALNTPLVYPVTDADQVEASVLFEFRFIYT